jgi:adenine-specific DNA-methyltransferase
MPLKLVKQIHDLIKTSEKFRDKEQNLYIPKILEAIEQIDGELIKLLISDEKIKNHFFTKIEDIYVLNQNKLIEFFTMNEYSKNSYTSYTNKIGLIKKDSFIKKFDDVVLAWPHKDCVLEGGQSRDDEKNNEVFYNEILSRDEIDRLFEPKAFTNIKKFSVRPELVEGCTHGSTSSPRTVNSDCEESTPTEITEDDNLIIKGNNLIALHSLKKKFAGKVKLIYIDPPYYFNENRDSDTFLYNSNFKLSTWLTFMKNRLEVAKEFLSDRGVIFVHIGEDSQAYTEILMNEIFPNNRLGVISRVQKKGSDLGVFFSPTLDYILCYSKNKNSLKGFKVAIDESKFKKIEIEGDRKGEKYEDSKSLYQSSLSDLRPEQKYFIECPDSTKVIPPCDVLDEVQRIGDKRWRWSKKKYLQDKHLLVFKQTKNSPLLDENGNQSKWNVYTKRYLKDALAKGNIPSNLFDSFTNSSATSTLSSMSINFSFSKPKELIEYIINIVQVEKNDIIMDFFGGSGTTAHAVLDINKEQNKNLKFILIEQMDYIEDITCERVKKVIKKNQQGSFVYAELKQIDTFKDAEIGKLNKNMQYLPYSEIEDVEYGISIEEIAINKKFYTKTGTSGLDNE